MRRGPVEIRVDILNALSHKSMSRREMTMAAKISHTLLKSHINFLEERLLIEAIDPPRRDRRVRSFYQITDLGREVKNNIVSLQPLFISDVPERWTVRHGE